MDQLDKLTNMAIDGLMKFAPKLLMALLIIVLGFWIISKLMTIFGKAMDKSKLTPEVTSFLKSLISIALKVLLLFSVAEIVGIETTSFVAVLAAAGFAIGMALQGSLGNFAAGIIIILFKPYKVGDWVEIQEKFGKVLEIQIFNTIVETPGMNRLIIPNGQVIDGIVTNFSSRGFVRLELEVTMPYSESFPKVKEVILDELKQVPNVLDDPPIEIGITDFDSHSIIVSVRPFCQPDDFWDVKFASYAAIKNAFNKHSIEVAYSEGVEMGKIGN